MAVWQFDLLLISRGNVISLFGVVPPLLEEIDLEKVESWKVVLLDINCEELFSSFVSVDESWSPEIQMWGEENGNRVEVVGAIDQPESIFIRIDARELNDRFLHGVVKAAERLDALLLLIENMKVIEPRLHLLKESVNCSNAKRWVDNPTKFIKSIRSGKTKIRPNNSSYLLRFYRVDRCFDTVGVCKSDTFESKRSPWCSVSSPQSSLSAWLD